MLRFTAIRETHGQCAGEGYCMSTYPQGNAAYELVTGRDLIHECTVLAADGAYASEEASRLASEKNITLLSSAI